MAISASMVKELRERTSAGMMECKKALTETDGDMDAAVQLLRTSGALSGDTLRALTEVAIAHEGRTYAFDEIRPALMERAEPQPVLEISFHAA